MEKQNNRVLGAKKEALAAAYLKKQGVEILTTNFRNRCGEIDLIGWDGDVLVFFEVKYRRSMQYGSPYAAVHEKKQRVICKVAEYFCLRYHIPMNTPIRYDVIGICGEEIGWLKNAFLHRY